MYKGAFGRELAVFTCSFGRPKSSLILSSSRNRRTLSTSHADVNLFPRAENLRACRVQFPDWPSENNFPADYSGEKLGLQPSDNERSVSYGADKFILQTCERLGLGWSQWQINGPDQFRRNWPLLHAAAIAKDYAWKPDFKR